MLAALLAAALGYGAAATGGGPICIAADTTGFRACVAGDEPETVTFTAGVRLEPGKDPVMVGSNTDIEGAGIAHCVHDYGCLWGVNAHNVIVRNMQFRSTLADIWGAKKPTNCAHPQSPADLEGCGVAIALSDESTDWWIDHNTFVNCGNKCVTGWARMPAPGARAFEPDRITISDNRFRDSFFAVLFGADEHILAAQMPAQAGRVTFLRNLYVRVMRRQPRCGGYYQCDSVNEWVLDYGGQGSCAGMTYGFGPSAVEGGQLLLRGDVQTPWPDPGSCAAPVEIDPDTPIPGGDRGLGQVAVDAPGGFTPPYALTPLPASAVPDAVANAGVQR